MLAKFWRTERWGGLLLALLLTLGALARLTTAFGQEKGGTLARGEALVEAKCSRCHATGRADASPDRKAPPFREIARIYPPEHLAEALAEGIVTGDNDMPEFKFDPKDIDAIIEYLSTIASAGKR